MTIRSRKRIYVYESGPEFRVMLETLLTADEVSVSGFSGHEDCLEKLAIRPCDLLIVDLDGCEPEGLDLLEQAKRMAPWVLSLALVEHGAIPCAIKAIKAGASDCLDKPVQPDRLLAAVGTQLARVDVSTHRRPRALTQMEVQILQLILAGRTSHDMAAELHRSKRTIDVHRKNIMHKLQATGLVDFIKRALGMGFADHPVQTTPPQKRPEEERGYAAEQPAERQVTFPYPTPQREIQKTL
ncbi:MAG: LuxR C-terminal-related transcriptional regulator [Phycisphaerae bacterium]|nr:LuxR C-terminal-related transcriptional regulator [Phycisphaerae bacterium]